MTYKIDLHTHSYGSPDGGLTLRAYRRALQGGRLDYIAITDHNTITTAQSIKSFLGRLGDRIIIGEEIMTTEGEIIGLFLDRTVPSGLTPEETTAQISAQGGLVYLPHPFETVRSGISGSAATRIAPYTDIVETANGRAVFEDRSREAHDFAERYEFAQAAASDAHGSIGWGRTYSEIAARPTPETLVPLLRQSRQREGKVGLGIMYPALHRLRKRFHR